MKKTSKVLGSIALSAALLMGAAPSAFADPWNPADPDFNGSSQSIRVSVNGRYLDSVDAANLSLDGQEPAAYLFKRGEDPATSTWNVVLAPRYLSLNDVLAKAGADFAWQEGASLEFTCWNEYDNDGEKTYREEPYTKWTFTYDQLMNQNLWYPETEINGVKGPGIEMYPSPVIAFSYASAEIAKGYDAHATAHEMIDDWDLYQFLIDMGLTPEEALDNTSYKWQQNTRFLTGLNEDTINATDGSNMGKRFPSSITAINVKNVNVG